MVHLKQTLQRSEKELQELRTALSEKDQKHQRRTARLEQQSRRWAQDIHSECVCLQELLAVDNKNSSDRYAHLIVVHRVCPCSKVTSAQETLCIGPNVGNTGSNVLCVIL